MSCQVRYVKHGQEFLSPIFANPNLADGYAKAVNGTVIPSTVLVPPITFVKVADPKVVDRLRMKEKREARQEQLAQIEFAARKAAKENGFSQERIDALGKAARQAAVDDEKDKNYSTCPLCEKPVYGNYTTCRSCAKL